MTKISNQYSLTNVLFADAVNGRVGIGTETPTEKLTVIGNIKIDNGAADGGQLTLASSGYSNWNIDNYSGSLRAYYNATEFLRITSSGYFSINSAVTSNGLVNIKQIGSARYGGINIYDDAGNTFLGLGNTGSLCVVEANYNTGSYTPLAFYTGGSERMRITSAGNVGISNTSPDTAYDAGNWFSAKGLTIGNTSTTAGLQIVSSPTSTLSSIRFGDGSDSLYDQGFINYSHNLDRLSLGANRNTTMVLTSSNNVLIGTTTDNGYKLNVSGSIYASSSIVSNSSMYAVGGIGSQGGIYIDYGYAFGLNSNTQNAANAWNFYVSSSFSNYLRFFYGGTGVGSGSAKFQIDTGGGYTGLSDVNKKKDISLSTLGLAEIMQLKPSTFKFKDDEKQEEQIGFIAQEVKDIIPQAYYEDEEGDDKFIGLKQTAFIPVLVKAIQEQQTQINELKALLNAH